MISKKYQFITFYCLLFGYTLFAVASHLNIFFQILLYAIIIIAPILLDKTKTISVYFYCACFMQCLGRSGFLTALTISLFILELRIIIESIKNKNFKNIKTVLYVWLGMLAILTIYSLLFWKFKVYRMAMFIDFVQCVFVLFLVRKDIDIKHVLLTLFSGILASVVTAGCYILIGSYNPNIMYSVNRFGAFFRNINTLSVYCTVCASSFIVLLLTEKVEFKKYFYIPIITTFMGLLTYSKAFIVVTVILYAIWILLSFIKSKNKKRFILISAVALVVFVLVLILSIDYLIAIYNRFTSGGHSSIMDNLTTGRIDIWKQYIDRWLKSPITFLFGNGYTSQKISTKQYEHSIYIAFLYQFGIVGTALIISTLVWTLKKNSKLQKNFSCYIPLILLMVNGIVSNLSGIMCTCLVWFMAFYFTTMETDTVKNINKEKNQDNNEKA